MLILYIAVYCVGFTMNPDVSETWTTPSRTSWQLNVEFIYKAPIRREFILFQRNSEIRTLKNGEYTRSPP